MKQLVRRFRDSSEGCVYNVYYDTNTGRYTQCRDGRDEEDSIESSDWHVRGIIR